MKAYIILGCDGCTYEDFKFCAGLNNIILDLEDIRASENYLTLIKYIDGVVKLFDGTCFKLSTISNAIYKIYELGYITEKKYKKICGFYTMHRSCGMYLKIIPK